MSDRFSAYFPTRGREDGYQEYLSYPGVPLGSRLGDADLTKAEPMAHHAGYERRDPRTGKLEHISPLGWTPIEPAKPQSDAGEAKPVQELGAVDLGGIENLHVDDHDSRVVYRYLEKLKPQTRDAVTAGIRQMVTEFAKKPQKGASGRGWC